jgi:low molecular weight phosphotyrosine protein phosphatase
MTSKSNKSAAADDEKINVLFVCLGNICRSPLAEAVFNQMVEKNGLSSKFGRIDSCGTGAYHAGDGYDDRTIAVCKQNKVPINGVSRKVRGSDFDEFNVIFGMDSNNVRNLQQMKPRSSKAEVYLFGEL